MKKLSIIITYAIALLFVNACASNESKNSYIENTDSSYSEESDLVSEKAEQYYTTEESSSESKVQADLLQQEMNGVENQKNVQDIISSKGFTNPYKDKKFIKTANIRFKVAEVYASSVAIENIVLAHDGFIINSNLNSNILRSEEFPKDANTNIRIDEYESRNFITLRVPNNQLHESLLQIANEIEFLDQRVLNADDVGLNLLEQELNIKRAAQNQGIIKSNLQGNAKLDDKLEAAAMDYERQLEIDLAKLKQMSIEDQVTYSTITIEIYENSKLQQSIVPNFDSFKSQFEISYLQELSQSFLIGIDIVKVVFKTLIAIWPVLLVLAIAFLVYKNKFK